VEKPQDRKIWVKKKEFKVLPVHVTKAHKGSGGIAPQGGKKNNTH